MKIILALAILLTLSACTLVGGSDNSRPSETVTAFFTHIWAEEFDEAEQLLSAEPSISLKATAADYGGIFDKLDYRLISETVDGNRAYLTVNISTLDFAQLMSAVISEAFFWAFEEITEEELYDLVNQLLIEQINANDAPVLEKEVTVVLELENNQWRIVPDDTFFDGISGGVLSFAEHVAGW